METVTQSKGASTSSIPGGPVGVRVVTDSSCDLPVARAAELGVEIVPLTIRFGNEEYVDRVELTNEQFWQKVATSEVLPETAAPSAGAFEATFQRLAAEGADGIVCINLSSRLSATMQSAQVAAKALKGTCPVEVVDSMSVSMGLGLQCINAVRMASENTDLDTIARATEDQARRTRLFGALDTLEHLRRGGRIGAAQALLGGMLSIKPVIEVRDGAVAEAGKVRTRSKSLRLLADKLAAAASPQQVFVFDAQAPDIDELVDMIAPTVRRDEIEFGTIGPVIGTHAGPRTIGVGWVDAP
ncbi:MAG: DegV family protein [Acidimicrobiia bacterium]